MKCKFCRAGIQPSATYCGACGRPTTAGPQRSVEEIEESINKAREADGKPPVKLKPRRNPGQLAVPANALRMYRDFWQLDPRKVGAFSSGFQIPREAALVGSALNVLYRSGKTDPSSGEVPRRPIDYIHEHDAGVQVYRTDASAPRRGVTTRVPAFIADCPALVLLGECLGFSYDDGEKEIVADGTRPLPELYTIPSGRALLVIQSKRTVKALIWGGRLGVEPRGIVH